MPKRVIIFGRCLSCWRHAWRDVVVDRHLPQGFQAICETCGAERTFATTGQVVPTLDAKSLRLLKGYQEGKRTFEWRQLPLVLDLTETHSPSS